MLASCGISTLIQRVPYRVLQLLFVRLYDAPDLKGIHVAPDGCARCLEQIVERALLDLSHIVPIDEIQIASAFPDLLYGWKRLPDLTWNLLNPSLDVCVQRPSYG